MVTVKSKFVNKPILVFSTVFKGEKAVPTLGTTNKVIDCPLAIWDPPGDVELPV